MTTHHECLTRKAAWDALTAENTELRDVDSEVEVLLVNRLNGAREYWISPIELCFELAGLIRVPWRGFSGGDKLWEGWNNFFARLRAGAGAGEASRHA